MWTLERLLCVKLQIIKNLILISFVKMSHDLDSDDLALCQKPQEAENIACKFSKSHDLLLSQTMKIDMDQTFNHYHDYKLKVLYEN